MVRLSKDEALERLLGEQASSAAFGGCVMCRLASPTNAEGWLTHNEHAVVVLDLYGATRGHLLVIARQHVERTSDLSVGAFRAAQQLVWEANIVLEAELQPQRVYSATLGASTPLPMSFPHFHTHVVPVYESDERARPANVFSWSSGVECYAPEELSALHSRLSNAWSTLGARHAPR